MSRKKSCEKTTQLPQDNLKKLGSKVGKAKNKSKKPKGTSSTARNPARLPTAPGGEMSSNWKSLLVDLQKEGSTMTKGRNSTKEASKPSKDFAVAEKRMSKPDIWFDDVDEMLLDPEDRAESMYQPSKGLVRDKSFKGVTKVLGMDCEMVGVGVRGEDSIVARVSIVNHFGHCIYDKYVKPTEKVVDYRTAVSGIRPKDLEKGEAFKSVQKEVYDLLKNRVLVGHALHHDLKVLFLDHPKTRIRDTSNYKPFRNAFGGKTPSLKKLTERMLGVKVQEGEHSSVQDAQAAVRLYTMFRKEWENGIKERKHPKKKTQKQAKISEAASATTFTKSKPPLYKDSDSE